MALVRSSCNFFVLQMKNLNFKATGCSAAQEPSSCCGWAQDGGFPKLPGYLHFGGVGVGRESAIRTGERRSLSSAFSGLSANEGLPTRSRLMVGW